jgi:hypothetical protein
MQVSRGTRDADRRVCSAGRVSYRRGDTAHTDVKLFIINGESAFSSEGEVCLQLLRLDDGLRRVWFKSLQVRPQFFRLKIGEQGFPDSRACWRGHAANRDIDGDGGGTPLLSDIESPALRQDHEVRGEARFLGKIPQVWSRVIPHIKPRQQVRTEPDYFAGWMVEPRARILLYKSARDQNPKQAMSRALVNPLPLGKLGHPNGMVGEYKLLEN